MSSVATPFPRIEFFKDSSVLIKGWRLDDIHGYWDWFRNDVTLMQSRYFASTEQTGRLTTCDAKGHVYKGTRMRSGAACFSKAGTDGN